MDIEKVLKKTGYTSIITSLVLGILGLVMFMYSEATLKIIAYVLGAILMLTGIIKIIGYFTQKGSYDLFNYELVYGIISILFGLVVATHTETLESLIGIILGVWIIYSSLMRFGLSLKLKAFEAKSWIAMLIVAVLMMICGIYIMFTPDIIIATLGLIILAYSIMDIIEGIAFIVNVNKLKKLDQIDNLKHFERSALKKFG